MYVNLRRAAAILVQLYYLVGISLTVWVIFGISNVNVQLCFGRFVCSNASRVPPR